MLHFIPFVAASAVSTEQMTEISSSLTSIAGNVLDTFIDLLPAVATIVGIAFVVRYVKGLTKRAGQAR